MEVYTNLIARQSMVDTIWRTRLIGSEDLSGLCTVQQKIGTTLLRTGQRQQLPVCQSVDSKNKDSRNGNGRGNGNGNGHGSGNGNGRAGRSAVTSNGARVKDEPCSRNGHAIPMSAPAPSRLEHSKGHRTKHHSPNPADRTSRTWSDGTEADRGMWDEPEGPHHALLDDDPLTWMTGKVSDYMTRQPLCLHKGMHLRDAAEIFLKRGIGGAPVVEKYENDKFGCGRLVGVISQKDIIWKETMHPQEADSLYKMPFYWNYLNAGPMMENLQKQVVKIMSRTVEDSMNANPVCISYDASISEASELMLTSQVSRLAVVAPREHNKPGKTVVGVLTGNDILRHVMLLL